MSTRFCSGNMPILSNEELPGVMLSAAELAPTTAARKRILKGQNFRLTPTSLGRLTQSWASRPAQKILKCDYASMLQGSVILSMPWLLTMIACFRKAGAWSRAQRSRRSTIQAAASSGGMTAVYITADDDDSVTVATVSCSASDFEPDSKPLELTSKTAGP